MAMYRGLVGAPVRTVRVVRRSVVLHRSLATIIDCLASLISLLDRTISLVLVPELKQLFVNVDLLRFLTRNLDCGLLVVAMLDQTPESLELSFRNNDDLVLKLVLEPPVHACSILIIMNVLIS